MASRLTTTVNQASRTLSRQITFASRVAPNKHNCLPLFNCSSSLHRRDSVLGSTSVRSISEQVRKGNMSNGKNNGDDTQEWQKKPPYLIHESNDGFKARYEASCHCGKVKYQLSREAPLDSKLCHCTTCQTQHAAPFQWAAIFHKTDINFSHGHHDLEWYDPTDKSIEHKLPCKVRCSFCHSPIMDEGRNMILLFPSLIHLKTDEDRANFKPRCVNMTTLLLTTLLHFESDEMLTLIRCHMFYSQRVMDIPDGLPKWSGISNDSDLIEDSPKEAVQEFERNRAEAKKEKAEKEKNDEKK